MRSILFALAFFALPLFGADPAWIEYGPTGPLARTIVSGDCPSITIDGKSAVMSTRMAPGKDYPVRTCESAIPAGATSAAIGSTTLPVAKLGKIGKIALVGDTGCRRKEGDKVQDCSDPKAWPFAEVADSIAAWDPDLIIHVGDYYYREAKCDSKGVCKGKIFNWKRWDADFFTPAAKLLPNAPWIVTRGNHEECSRAAEGWFRFLEPRAMLWEGKKTCQSNTTFTPPYSVTLAGQEFIVFDSSAANANEYDAGQAAQYATQLSTLNDATPGSWLILHHPFWALKKDGPLTETMWNAWQQSKPAPPVALVLTGHIHLLEMLGFGDGRPPLALVGNGGTALAKAPSGNQVGTTIGGRTVSSFFSRDDFGFVAAVPKGNGAWTFTIMSKKGNPKATCEVTTTTLTCL